MKLTLALMAAAIILVSLAGGTYNALWLLAVISAIAALVVFRVRVIR